MTDARLRRVNKEIAGQCLSDIDSMFSEADREIVRADCKNDKSSKIELDLVDNSPFHLIGSFDGPEDTPYQGGHFQVVRALAMSIPLSGTSYVADITSNRTS